MNRDRKNRPKKTRPQTISQMTTAMTRTPKGIRRTQSLIRKNLNRTARNRATRVTRTKTRTRTRARTTRRKRK